MLPHLHESQTWQWMWYHWSQLHAFMGNGGWILWAIFALSLCMWMLICERYWFILFSYPRCRRALVARWQQRTEHDSWYAHRVRAGLIDEARAVLQRGLNLIQVCTHVLPLLGLLGTVSGMITTFDLMMLFGTDDMRVLAMGISEALVTTLAGLLTAISGVYFSNHLQHKAQRELQRTADVLCFSH